MVDGRMACDKIQKDMHAARMDLPDQFPEVVVGPVPRCDFIVVTYIVACVIKGRIIARVHPDRVTAEVLKMIELSDDTPDVADAVPVAVRKGLRVDLIKYCVF